MPSIRFWHRPPCFVHLPLERFKMKTSIFALGCLLLAASCEANPAPIQKDPSGSGGNSSSSNSVSSNASTSVSSSSSSASSSSGQGNGGSDPGLPCNPCEHVDGSRLIRQRTKIVGSDGLVFYYGTYSIYDTLEKVTCSSSVTEDGVVRCVPSGMVYMEVYFSDAACTIPVAFSTISACQSPISLPKYAGEVVAGASCNDPSKLLIYEIASEFMGQLYIKSGNTCTTTAPLPTYKYYAVGNKVAPSTFVQIDIQTVP